MLSIFNSCGATKKVAALVEAELVTALELVQLSIGYMLVNKELAKFAQIKISLVVEPRHFG